MAHLVQSIRIAFPSLLYYITRLLEALLYRTVTRHPDDVQNPRVRNAV
jgi:hypothetical protein